MTTLCRTWLALSICALSAAPAAAQEDDDSPEVREEARRLFEQGVQALEESRFSDAANLLARSLELRDSPPARYNRALALRGAGRYIEAIEEVERYLPLATERRHAETRAQAEIMLTELRGYLGRARVEITGGAERVEIDGEVAASEDGVIELTRDPGPLRVVASREGYSPVSQEVEVGRGGSVTVQLDASESPLPATLDVSVDPETAAIHMDGNMLGLGSAHLELDPGSYHLELSAEGYLPEERDVSLAPGASQRLAVTLSIEPSDPVTQKWWFWTLIASGAAAIGAAIAVGVVIANDQPPIFTGTLDFSQEVLRQQ